MSYGKSLVIPIERGDQLEEFARVHSHKSLGDAIGALLDHATKTGLTPELPLRDIEIVENDGSISLRIGTAWLRMTLERAHSIAGSIQKVATTPSEAAILDMDDQAAIEINRRGRSVAIAIRKLNQKDALVHRTFACGVALALAERIEKAAANAAAVNEILDDMERIAGQILPTPEEAAEAAKMEALLGDLDSQ